MHLDIGLSLTFLLLLGFAILNGRNVRSGIGEVPLMYRGEFVLNILLVAFVGLTIFLVFYRWKLLLALMAIGFFTGSFVLVPLAEKLLFAALNLLIHKSTERREKQNQE